VIPIAVMLVGLSAVEGDLKYKTAVDTHNTDAACRLPPNRDFTRVPPKSRNIVGYPLKTHALVQQTEVGCAVVENFLPLYIGLVWV
jgi:hypothetical protein